MTKSRFVLVLHLIGWQGSASFLAIDKSQRVVQAKPMQSRITFDTQLKIGLLGLSEQTSTSQKIK